MKIAEELGDNEGKEKAKVNFGMANANLKWDKHQVDVLQKVNEPKVTAFGEKENIRIAEEENDDDEEDVLDGTEDPIEHLP